MKERQQWGRERKERERETEMGGPSALGQFQTMIFTSCSYFFVARSHFFDHNDAHILYLEMVNRRFLWRTRPFRCQQKKSTTTKQLPETGTGTVPAKKKESTDEMEQWFIVSVLTAEGRIHTHTITKKKSVQEQCFGTSPTKSKITTSWPRTLKKNKKVCMSVCLNKNERDQTQLTSDQTCVPELRCMLETMNESWGSGLCQQRGIGEEEERDRTG